MVRRCLDWYVNARIVRLEASPAPQVHGTLPVSKQPVTGPQQLPTKYTKMIEVMNHAQ